MRSKTAQRILEETPQEIKDKVREETDKRLNMKNIQIGTLEAFNINNLKDITHRVTNINIDVFGSNVSVIIEKGTEVSAINISLQEAKNIGFINLDALKPYCK